MSLMPGWEHDTPGVPPPGMQDDDDAAGGLSNKKDGGYLATYARLKSLRRDSMTLEQQALAAAATAEAAAAAGGGGDKGAPPPSAESLARQSSLLSRRPSLKARDATAAVVGNLPSAAASQPGPLQRRSLPLSPLAAGGASRRSSLDDGPSPRAAASPSYAEHEKWWSRMDSARFNEPRAPGPDDPPPLRPHAALPHARAPPGDDGGHDGGDEGRARMWSPYSLRRGSSASGGAGPSNIPE